ncbi:hypothetical protein BJV77DRAFT_961891 [Russula vinacea]|nr:hypothetical protein BJV77DRAFT_961891 [Russula vinacea]
MDSGIYNVDAFRQTDVSGINFAIRCVIGRYSKFLIRQSQAENQLCYSIIGNSPTISSHAYDKDSGVFGPAAVPDNPNVVLDNCSCGKLGDYNSSRHYPSTPTRATNREEFPRQMRAHRRPRATIAVQPQDARQTLEVIVNKGVIKHPRSVFGLRNHGLVSREKREFRAGGSA